MKGGREGGVSQAEKETTSTWPNMLQKCCTVVDLRNEMHLNVI